MSDEYTYSNVPVHVKLSPDGSVFVVGVETEGAFHPVASFKTGGFNKRLKAAHDRAAAASQPSE